jgi:hypothetical protein
MPDVNNCSCFLHWIATLIEESRKKPLAALCLMPSVHCLMFEYLCRYVGMQLHTATYFPFFRAMGKKLVSVS